MWLGVASEHSDCTVDSLFFRSTGKLTLFKICLCLSNNTLTRFGASVFFLRMMRQKKAQFLQDLVLNPRSVKNAKFCSEVETVPTQEPRSIFHLGPLVQLIMGHSFVHCLNFACLMCWIISEAFCKKAWKSTEEKEFWITSFKFVLNRPTIKGSKYVVSLN